MKDTIEIYVQPGKHGLHAGGRHPCQAWAAHATDEKTAAWRCALRHWFPKRANGVLLYSEAMSVRVEAIGQHEYKATLDVPDKGTDKPILKQAITPSLVSVEPKPTKRARKVRRRTEKKK